MNSSGRLDVHVIAFEDPKYQLANGTLCCRDSDSPDQKIKECNENCRIFFRVCVDSGTGTAARPVRSSPLLLRGIRISRIRSRRRGRSAVAQEFTDTPVPQELPSIDNDSKLELLEEPIDINDEDELLSASEDEPSDDDPEELATSAREAAKTPQEEDKDRDPEQRMDKGDKEGTSIQVVHRLIPTTNSSNKQDASTQTELPRQPLHSPQDIGLFFVEDNGLVRLYFEPRSPATGFRSKTRRPFQQSRLPFRGRFRRHVQSHVEGDAVQDSANSILLSSKKESNFENYINNIDGSGSSSLEEGVSRDEIQNKRPNRYHNSGYTWRHADSRNKLPGKGCSLGSVATPLLSNKNMDHKVAGGFRLSVPFNTVWPVSQTRHRQLQTT